MNLKRIIFRPRQTELKDLLSFKLCARPEEEGTGLLSSGINVQKVEIFNYNLFCFLSCLHLSLHVVISNQHLSHFFLHVNCLPQMTHILASFHLPMS